MSEVDLPTWIEAAARGDEVAVGRILDAYGPIVRRLAGRKLGAGLRARADSEDVLQSAMVAAVANLAAFEYRGEAAFVGWLSSITAQQVAQLARHHGAQRRAPSRERRLSEAPPLHANLTSVTQAAARKDDHEQLHRAMSKLPEPDQEVVRLRSLEGLAFGEVAERLGLEDQHAARYLYRRGLKSLGRLMAGGTAHEA